jgi:hypothetical protein
MIHWPIERASSCSRGLAWVLLTAVAISPVATTAQDSIFAVVTGMTKDRRQVTAQASIGGTVSEVILIPTDEIMDNPIWRQLEICHSLKAEGPKGDEGYRISSVKILDAGMLPMALQGIAGECLLKKALDYAPLVD